MGYEERSNMSCVLGCSVADGESRAGGRDTLEEALVMVQTRHERWSYYSLKESFKTLEPEGRQQHVHAVANVAKSCP